MPLLLIDTKFVYFTAENNKYIVEALYELGESQMASDDMTGALKTFAKFLAKVKRIPDHKGICDAHKQLAIAHEVYFLNYQNKLLQYMRHYHFLYLSYLFTWMTI